MNACYMPRSCLPGPARPHRPLPPTPEQQGPHPPTRKLPAGPFVSPAQLTGPHSTFQHTRGPAVGGKRPVTVPR